MITRPYCLALTAVVLVTLAMSTIGLLDPDAPPGARSSLVVVWIFGGIALLLLLRAWLDAGRGRGD